MILYGWKIRPLCNRLRKKNGAVLIYVLAVMVILLILFFAAFTFVANRHSYHIKEQNRVIAKNLAQAGLTRGILQASSKPLRFEPIEADSPNGGQIYADFSAWGPYLLITSKGTYANQEVECQSLIGTKSDNFFDAAITIADETMPLVASGNTLISGDVNTGSQGLTTGRMRGESIVNENFHNGNVNIFPSISVPVLDSNVIEKYMDEVKTRKQECNVLIEGSAILTDADVDLLRTSNCIAIENNLRMQNIVFSDFGRIHSIFVNGFVEVVGNNHISGLIEIVSTGAIYVSDSSVLDNVILMTPDSINFSDNSIFSGTAISNLRINVNERAQLHYPSLLLIRDKSDLDDFERGMYLTSKGKMESTCYAESRSESPNRIEPIIYLDSTSTFTGVIVSQGKSDLRGMVNGSVFTERFHYFSTPTTYVNWLKDFKIDRAKLDYWPVLPLFEHSDESVNVAVLRSDYP